MQTTTSRPELVASPTNPIGEVDATRRALSQAHLALIAAVVAPLAIIGLLVVIGLGIGAAVCITFVVVVVVTTTSDVAWVLRRRRLGNDGRRPQP